MRGAIVVMCTALIAGLPFGALAGSRDMEARVERLERLLESQSLVEILARLDAMQRELQQLRGKVEEQEHALSAMRERQRELYLDIDRRMSQFERESAARVPAGSLGTAAAATGGDRGGEDLGQEREAYEKAFNLLRDLRYEQAISAFRAFLTSHPNGRYAHIAQYWLGEANYARRDFKAAIADYRTLIESHPQSAKVAEAMLKIGYSHYELGQAAEAKQELDSLVKKYPGTTEAGQAAALLKRMKREAS